MIRPSSWYQKKRKSSLYDSVCVRRSWLKKLRRGSRSHKVHCISWSFDRILKLFTSADAQFIRLVCVKKNVGLALKALTLGPVQVKGVFPPRIDAICRTLREFNTVFGAILSAGAATDLLRGQRDFVTKGFQARRVQWYAFRTFFSAKASVLSVEMARLRDCRFTEQTRAMAPKIFFLPQTLGARPVSYCRRHTHYGKHSSDLGASFGTRTIPLPLIVTETCEF